MIYKFILYSIFFIQVFGQISRNKIDINPILNDTIHIVENNTIIGLSEELKLNHLLLEKNKDYIFLYSLKKLILLIDYSSVDSLKIEYESIVIKNDFSLFSFNTELDKDSSNLTTNSRKSININKEKDKDAFSKLNKNGSIYRGFRIGTESDLSFESSLNINVNGKINDEYTLNAALADESIPIQPEGSTQNISDIDKIYIEVSSETFKSIIGDHNIKYDEGGIYNYQKRLQGLSIAHKGSNHFFESSISNARTNFNSYEFLGKEGILGPYQLKGKNDVEEIIVIAGSEKVYLNGLLLKRGFNYDYIIEYANGTIEFTSNTLISADDKIEVDFEYVGSDQKFNKNVNIVNGNINNEKISYKLRIISEIDDETSPLETFSSYDEEDKKILKLAGDNRLSASKKNIVKSKNLNFYSRVYNSSINDSIWLFNSSGNGEYNVTFSNVGENNGSYSRISRFSNEFEFVGKNNGSYEAIQLIAQPQTHNQITQAIEYKFDTENSVVLENTITLHDKNTLSNKDDSDNEGFLTRVELNNTFKPKYIDRLRFFTTISHESQQFDALNKYYEQSFFERFGFSNNDKSNSRTRIDENVTIDYNANHNSAVNFTLFDEINSYQSKNISFFQNSSFSQSLPDLSMSYMHNESDNKSNDYIFNKKRFYVDFSKKYDNSSYSLNFENQYRSKEDSLFLKKINISKANSVYSNEDWFDLIKLSISAENSQIYYSSSNSYENYKETILSEFEINEANKTLSNNFKFAYKDIYINPLFKSMSAQEKLRTFDVSTQDTSFVDNNFLLLENEFTYNSSKRDISISFNYQLRKMQTAIKEAIYKKVEKGYGQFVLDSLSRDFVRDPIAGNYIRFILASGSYIPVTALSSEINFKYNADKNRINHAIYQNFLKYISINSRLRITEESRANDNSLYYFDPNAFQNDKTLIGQLYFQNYLYIDRSNKSINSYLFYKYDSKLNNNYIRNSDLLNNSVISRDYKININYELSNTLRANNSVMINDYLKTQSSNSSLNRDIDKYSFSQDINYFPNSDLSANLNFTYNYEESFIEIPAAIDKYDYSLNLTYRILDFAYIKANYTHSKVNNAKSSKNIFIPFELADGKKIGTNTNWSVNTNYEMSQNIYFNLIYNGRKFVFDKKTFHYLKMEVQLFL